MKKYNFTTNEYEEEDVYCYGCGELIEGNKGLSIRYIEIEKDKKIKVNYGSCCVGKIHAYDSIHKQSREKYRSSKQIPDELLSKLPLAPPPVANSSEAGKEVHSFVDGIGRSKLSKSYDGKVKYKKSKGMKKGNEK
jgi:hypothetical protein